MGIWGDSKGKICYNLGIFLSVSNIRHGREKSEKGQL